MDFLKITTLFAQDFYAVPDYQRDYEWTNAQNSTLLDDIFSVMKTSTNGNHFLGAIVTVPYDSDNAVNKSIDFDEYSIDGESVKHIVDGQQRLTSFSLLIRAIYSLIEDNTNISDVFKNNYLQMIRPLINGSAYNNNGSPAPRLILNGNTGFCYNSEILNVRNDGSHKGYKGAKRILGAYSLFRNEIDSRCTLMINNGIFDNEEMYYKRLVDTIRNKILFVEIKCDKSSDAFQVFDSLNGKGLDLTAADRIKNIMMSWSPASKGAQKWDALIQSVGEDYLASFFVSLFFFNCGTRVAKNKLPDEFKNTYKNSATEDFDYFYSSIKTDGKLYGDLRQNKTSNKELNDILLDFNALKLDQVYVMLFAAAKHFGNEKIDSAEFKVFAQKLLALIVRMQVCEKTMNKLDQVFSECIDKMKNQNASLSVISNYLDEKKQSISNDTQFLTSFATFAPKDSRVEEFYLRKLEEYRRKVFGRRDSVERGLTVEHIIPQTIDDTSSWYGDVILPDELRENFQDDIVESIGNKALLYGDDNASAGNKDYSYKKTIYQNGKRGQNQGTPIDTFLLISDLMKNYPDKFNHEEVLERAKEFASYAIKIW